MMTRPLPFLFFPLLLFFFTPLMGSEIKWAELPPIPDQEGFAGMYAGVSNGVLISAGGANFPGKKPWEGGEKVWYDNIYYLLDMESEWKLASQKLPKPAAY